MSSSKVKGIGGIFFKCEDPSKMNHWYEDTFGLTSNGYGVLFESRDKDKPEQREFLQLGTFPSSTDYFKPSSKDFMINFRVENLEVLLEELKLKGIQQVGDIIRESYGLFAHILDPEGNKIELWEPIHKEFEKMVDKEQ